MSRVTRKPVFSRGLDFLYGSSGFPFSAFLSALIVSSKSLRTVFRIRRGNGGLVLTRLFLRMTGGRFLKKSGSSQLCVRSYFFSSFKFSASSSSSANFGTTLQNVLPQYA